MSVQWAHLPGGDTLVASRQRAWIQQPALAALGLHGPMTDSVQSTVAVTRHLLDGAIAAGERGAPRIPPPPLTATRWAWHLVGQWYSAHHGVALLPEVTRRFDAMGHHSLAQFARRKLEEEQGHDRFPLDDLRALGYDAAALVGEVRPPPAAKAEVDFARACARGEHPVEFLGYVYAQERRVIRIPQKWLTDLAATVLPGVEVASAIRLHARELDGEHVDEAVRFIAGLPADDRTRIAQACYRTARISCDTYQGQDPAEAELERRLADYRHARVTPHPTNTLARQGERP